jgi:hypothetical protein
MRGCTAIARRCHSPFSLFSSISFHLLSLGERGKSQTRTLHANVYIYIYIYIYIYVYVYIYIYICIYIYIYIYIRRTPSLLTSDYNPFRAEN